MHKIESEICLFLLNGVIIVLDSLDSKAISLLMRQGRMTWTELGNALGLSAPAAADRVRRLEERGILRGFAAIGDPESLGCGLGAFIAVTLEKSEHREPFLLRIKENTTVLECHHLSGDDDYLLKVRTEDIRSLERLIGEELKGIPGVLRTRTTVILATEKETPVLPLPREEAPS